MKLYRWQEDFIKFVKTNLGRNNKGLYLNADAGTGKTIAALSALAALNIRDIFVVCPLSAKESWATDIKHFPELNLIDVITYEKMGRREIIPPKDSFIIFDEAHRLKNPKAKITKHVIKNLNNYYKLLLSGTRQDKLFELYSQYKIIKPDIFNGWSWSRFINRYFIINNFFQPTRPINKYVAKEILDEVEPLTFRVHLEDVTELPPLTEVSIKLPESRKIKKVIKDYKEEELTPVSMFIKEYQISQGVKEDKIFDETKIKWTLDFLRDNPDTIVFSYFKKPVFRLRELLKDKAYFIIGEDKKSLREAIEASKKPIIATYALKEGANLQNYSKIVFLSLPLAYRDSHQAKARVYRNGQKRKVVVYKLLQNKKDYEVEAIIKTKKSLNEWIKENYVSN